MHSRIWAFIVGLLLGIQVGSSVPADATTPSLHLCYRASASSIVGEHNCVWDAAHQGNREGRSFWVQPGGRKVFIHHRRAWQILERHCYAFSLTSQRWHRVDGCVGPR